MERKPFIYVLGCLKEVRDGRFCYYGFQSFTLNVYLLFVACRGFQKIIAKSKHFVSNENKYTVIFKTHCQPNSRNKNFQF